MASPGEQKLQLSLQDLWDWAYCPLRVWWRRSGLMPAGADLSGKHTGETLVRQSILTAVDLFYRPDRPQACALGECLGWVWRRWLEGWGVAEALSGPLVEYHSRRRSLLRRFEEGDLTRRDGSRYVRPMWTRYWRELAAASGLDQLRILIDSYHSRIGLGSLELDDAQRYHGPLGLADAFADALDCCSSLDLPPAGEVLGVGVPFRVELPSVQLHGQADLVRRLQRTRPVGRPPADAVQDGWVQQLELGLFLLDPQLPPAHSLARDLRLLAYSQARLQADREETPAHQVQAVRLYHLPGGTSQTFHPQLGDGMETLESLARAVVNGLRAGAYVPRMVCGWQACGECDFRRLCFAGDGVLAVFNPPLAAQVEAARLLRQRLGEVLDHSGASLPALRALGEWMAAAPSLTPQGLLWLLDNWECEAC